MPNLSNPTSKCTQPEKPTENVLKFVKKKLPGKGGYIVTASEQLQPKDVQKGQKRIDADLLEVVKDFERLWKERLRRLETCKSPRIECCNGYGPSKLLIDICRKRDQDTERPRQCCE